MNGKSEFLSSQLRGCERGRSSRWVYVGVSNLVFCLGSKSSTPAHSPNFRAWSFCKDEVLYSTLLERQDWTYGNESWCWGGGKTLSVSVEPCLWVSPAATKDMAVPCQRINRPSHNHIISVQRLHTLRTLLFHWKCEGAGGRTNLGPHTCRVYTWP